MSAIDVLHLASDTSSATVSPFGAHVLTWAPVGERPVLWLSPGAVMDGSTAIRGGIPVCYPWFANPATSISSHAGATSPHGLVRTATWTEEPGGTESERTFTHVHRAGDADGVFPHDLRAQLRVTLSEDLLVCLTVTNEDDHPVRVDAALHTYLAVGDVKDVTLEGLEGCTFVDTAEGRERTQVGEVTFVGLTDRLYDTEGPVVLRDPRWLRTITVDKEGSATTVVWNPWLEASQALGDMGPSNWQDFVCVEVANARKDAICLAPGESHAMSMTLHVDPLE